MNTSSSVTRPHVLLRVLSAAGLLALSPGVGFLVPSAQASTVPNVSRLQQRFFPDQSAPKLSIKSIDTATNEFVLAKGSFNIGAVAPALVESLGGSGSSPAISLYTGATSGSPTSADPSLLYYLRITDKQRFRLYLSEAEAKADSNAISLTGTTSSTPVVYVSTSNWCWDACSQMVLNAFNVSKAQDEIADNAMTGLKAGHFYNEPNHLTNTTILLPDVSTYPSLLARRGVGSVLKDLGSVKSQFFAKEELTDDQIQSEIDGGRPLIFQIGWYSGDKRNGGHVFVTYGKSGDSITIADPWPTNSGVTLSISALRSSGYMTTGKWEAALATGKALDVLFLIDTTGSMQDNIDDVKAKLSTIITKISTEFSNYRLAVADYKDLAYPDGPGDYGDYVYSADLPWTTSASSAQTAINGLNASGGGDIPESVYTALNKGLAGEGIGAWRTGSTIREIVIVGDAPGHDPEPWAGGTNSSAVIAAAKNTALPIHITGIVVGDNSDALVMGDLLAGATGGISLNAGNSSDVGAAIIEAVDQLATNPRTPQGNVASIFPAFSLVEQDPGGMTNSPSRITLELDRKNTKGKWVHYKTVSLPGDATTTTLRGPLPLADYRWRLGLTFAASTLVSPSETILQKVKAHKSVEADYTEFTRVLAPPSAPTIVSPDAYSFTATDAKQTYTWNAAAGATAYQIEIFGGGKIKRLKVNLNATNRDAATLSVTVGGHKVGTNYSWHIQGLNYDVPKAIAGKYTPY